MATWSASSKITSSAGSLLVTPGINGGTNLEVAAPAPVGGVTTILAPFGSGIAADQPNGVVTLSNAGVKSLTASTPNVTLSTSRGDVLIGVDGVLSVAASGNAIDASSSGGDVTLTSNITGGNGLSVTGTAGNVSLANTGVTSVAALGLGLSVSSASGDITLANTGITSLSAGDGISAVTSIGGAANIENKGVLCVAASGTGLSVSSASGDITLANTGITSLTPGVGISAVTTGGAATIANTGVTSVTAGTGLSVSSASGDITLANTGITSLTPGVGISAVTTGGAATITNTGVLSVAVSGNALGRSSTGGAVTLTSAITGGSGLSVTGTGGNISLANTGVTSVTAGTGLSVSSASGSITLANTGITSLTPGVGISATSVGGAATVSNTGVTSLAAGTGSPGLGIGVSSASGASVLTNLGITSVKAGTGLTATGTTNPNPSVPGSLVGDVVLTASSPPSITNVVIKAPFLNSVAVTSAVITGTPNLLQGATITLTLASPISITVGQFISVTGVTGYMANTNVLTVAATPYLLAANYACATGGFMVVTAVGGGGTTVSYVANGTTQGSVLTFPTFFSPGTLFYNPDSTVIPCTALPTYTNTYGLTLTFATQQTLAVGSYFNTAGMFMNGGNTNNPSNLNNFRVQACSTSAPWTVTTIVGTTSYISGVITPGVIVIPAVVQLSINTTVNVVSQCIPFAFDQSGTSTGGTGCSVVLVVPSKADMVLAGNVGSICINQIAPYMQYAVSSTVQPTYVRTKPNYGMVVIVNGQAASVSPNYAPVFYDMMMSGPLATDCAPNAILSYVGVGTPHWILTTQYFGMYGGPMYAV